MKAFKNITALTVAIVLAVICLAQFSPKQSATICKKCQQEAAASTSKAEDFNLISLLTLKFM